MSETVTAMFRSGMTCCSRSHGRYGILLMLAVLTLSSTLQAQTFAPIQPLAFTKVFAGANPLPQTLTVNSVGAAFNFTSAASTSSGGDWLSVSIGPGCFSSGACGTPHAITVTANPIVTLAPGTYTGQIVFTSTPGSVAMTVPISLTIVAAGSAFLDNMPGQMSFSLKTSSSTPPSQSIQVRNGGAGALNWTLAVSTSDGGNWLSASAANGTAPSFVTIALQKANLPGGGLTAGTFTGRLLFQTTGSSITVPVSVVVGADVFRQVNPISFNKVFSGPNPLSQTLTIASTGTELTFFTVDYAATGGNWLTASIGPGCFSSGACNSPHAITITANPEVTQAAGTYTGQVVFTTTTGSMAMTVPVTLTIVPAATPVFDNTPGQLSFSLQTSGSAPPAQTIEIRNGASTGLLDWTVSASTSDGGNWLTPSPTNGTASTQVSVSISPASLPGGGLVAGTFTGQLVFASSGIRVTVPVSVIVGANVFRQVNAITFSKVFAGANPLPQTLTIAGTGTTVTFFTNASTSSGGDWLSASIGPGCFSSGACNTPHTITVNVNPAANLVAGTYTGQVVFTSTDGAMAMTVPVTLTIAPASTPFFANLPGQLSYSMKTAGSAPPAQSLQIRNGGPGTLNWTLAASTADGGDWLDVSAQAGAAPSLINISVDKLQLPGSGLVAGTFTGRLIFQAAGGGSVTIPVSVVVGSDVFSQVNGISFVKAFGGANPLPQTLTIASTGATLTYFTETSTAIGGDWLTASIGPNCFSSGACNTPHTVTVSVNPTATLLAGTYTGQVVLTTSTGSMAMTVPVTLTVAPVSSPFFDNVQGQMSFSFQTLQTPGTNPPAQTIQLRNAGGGTLNWTLATSTADGGDWLGTSAVSGAAPGVVNVSINANALPGSGLIPGTFTGLLLFRSSGGDVTIPVSVIVGPSVFSQLSPVSFSKTFGGANPLSQTVTVDSIGTAFIFFTDPSTGKGGDWLSASIGSGCFSSGACNTPHVITISVNPSAVLAAGTYTGQIVFTATTGSMAMTIPVYLTIGAQTCTISATSGSGQSTTVSTAFASPLVATVKDPGNNACSGVPVTFTAPGSGASGSFAGSTTVNTNAQGVATSPAFTANGTTGSYNVTATASNVGGTANFALTNTAIAPCSVSITATSGSGQSATINTAFANRLVATVRGALNNPCNGVTVTFTAPGSGASGTFTGGNTAVTNAQGVATSPVFTANGTQGSYNVSATAPNVATAANFALTNDPVAPTRTISAIRGIVQTALVNTAFASRFVALVRDNAGNPASGVTVTFNAPTSGPSGGFAGGANTAVTNAQGVATSAIFNANGTSGAAYAVTATVPGSPTPARYFLTNQSVVGCVTSIAPTAATAPALGTAASFAVTAPAGCAWTAFSSQPWLEIFPLNGTGLGAISWTAYPNFGTTARTATATVGNRTFTITQAGNASTSMQRFVRLLYFSFLGRGASDAEVAGQVNSGQSRTQLAINFLNSAEFNLGGRFTAGLYVGIIERDAEFTGWQFQRQALARGIVNQDQLVSNFINSAEFNLKYGSISNADFVRLMYQNILLRPAAQAEVNAWLNVLSNPANTRTIVARSFLNSPEFQSGTGPRLLAFLLYSTLLLRDPSPEERTALENTLKDPAQLAVQLASFANGVEIDFTLQ